MTGRELILCALKGEENQIPLWHMGFENMETARRLIGDDNVPDDIEPQIAYKKGAASNKNMHRKVAFARQLDSSVIGVGKGGGFAFGHGGPGEFMDRLLEKGENYYVSVNETGVKKEMKRNPHFYRHFDYPALTPEDFYAMEFPKASDTARYLGIKEEAEFYKKEGFFTYANINGFFSGLHYFLCPYDELMVYLLTEPEFIESMLKKLGEFNLTAAENLLRCKVDCITFCDDLGSGNNLLFSPELYEKYFFNWHKQLADLCHSYGAYVHMHSHGNINRIMGKIAETGIDMINPCDPYEEMDIKALKSKYKGKITWVGGVDKFFFTWDDEKMKTFLKNLIKDGKNQGGYVFMDSSGGIPSDVSEEKFSRFMELSRELRYNQNSL